MRLVSPNEDANRFDAPTMSNEEFEVLRDLLRNRTGISLSVKKKDLLRTRLRMRLLDLDCTSFSQYHDLLQTNGFDQEEFKRLINCVTTNKTDFFREAHHFEFLKSTALPAIVEAKRKSNERKIRIWSAGCSTGQEAYSIAMTVKDYFRNRPGWDVRILASDIDTECLQKAKKGIYDLEQIESLSLMTKKKFFLRGTEKSAGKVLVRPELKRMISFRRINFADRFWPIQTSFDAVFCRNAIIYFDHAFQKTLLRRYLKFLLPHSYLFLGHSESVTWMNEVQRIGNTIYRMSGSSTNSITPTVKKLVAGEALASNQPVDISALLGSCVAACLFDHQARVGGMNHVLFSDSVSSQNKSNHATAAMELLIQKMRRLGSDPRNLVAKLYGGAKLFDGTTHRNQVGTDNVRAVHQFLKDCGIPVVEQRIGGNTPIRVSLRANTGEVSIVEMTKSSSTISPRVKS